MSQVLARPNKGRAQVPQSARHAFESRSAKARALVLRVQIAAIVMLHTMGVSGTVSDTSETILAEHTVLAVPLADHVHHRRRGHLHAALGLWIN